MAYLSRGWHVFLCFSYALVSPSKVEGLSFGFRLSSCGQSLGRPEGAGYDPRSGCGAVAGWVPKGSGSGATDSSPLAQSHSAVLNQPWRVRARGGSSPLLATVGPASTVDALAEGNSTSSSPVLMEAAAGAGAEGTAGAGDAGGITEARAGGGKRQNFIKTLWQFSRPHTVIGTMLAIPSLAIFSCPPGAFNTRNLVLGVLWALIPSLFINLYITGLNQVTDVEIDKINKPKLPIVAGHLSLRAAKVVISLSLVAGTVLGLMPGPFASPGLAMTVVLSILLGTCYSLPPVRLKRFPQLASTCILVVRGSLINAGFYAHGQMITRGLGGEKSALAAFFASLREGNCILAVSYFTIFAFVIALMKDVPDVSGDLKAKIYTFSVRFGEKNLFKASRRLLTALLWSSGLVMMFKARAAAVASMPIVAGCRAVVGLLALTGGQVVRSRSTSVDPKNSAETYKFYMFAWKVFYASYLALPFAR